MHISQTHAARFSSSSDQEAPPTQPVTGPEDTFVRTKVTQFTPARDSVSFMQELSEAFTQGVQRIVDTAAKQPTTADLTAAKQLDVGLASRHNKGGRDLATLGFGHALRKARRGWQDGHYGKMAQGAGMVTLSVTGLAAATLSIFGLEILILRGVGQRGDAHKCRSAAGTLKYMVSVEIYRLEDQLRGLTRHIDDSFVTGELSPAYCLQVVSTMRRQLPTLRSQLEQNPEPRIARSRRLPRQIDAIDRLLKDVEAQAEKHRGSSRQHRDAPGPA